MERFDSDFTAALTEFVRGTAIPFNIQTIWDHTSVAAPERHVALGSAIDTHIDTLILQLMNQNQRFDEIGAVLHVYATKEALRALIGVPIDVAAEQVWLFGSYWFSKYYQYLLEAKTLRSEFYRTRHHEFLALLARMCAVDPRVRPSFRDALDAWCFTRSQSEDDDECEPAAPPVAASDAAAPRRRLVLAGWGGHAARSKTRRNPRN
jgi:hypothetical protein